MLLLRRYSICLLLFAAVVAVEPLLHSHPLEQNSIPGPCAVCATGVVRLPHIAAVLTAPRLIVYTLTAQATRRLVVPAASTLPSRAPPLA